LYIQGQDIKKALSFLHRAVASTACTECYGDKFIPEGETRGIKAEGKWDDVCWHPSLLASKKGADPGEVDVVPRAPWEVSPEEKKIIDQILGVGDKWTMKKGKPGPEPTRGANSLGHILYTLGNHLMQAGKWEEAGRPLKTAAAMLQNDLDMQGNCFHLLGVVHFQIAKLPINRARVKEILPRAASSFALSADCRIVDGKCTKKGAADSINSLLFLGRCMFELGEFEQTEQVTAQAINLGRQVLGDSAKETNEAIKAMMEFKRQMSTMGR
jgi:tetratricopeptide (TPR) repeat protein